jgi:chorismate mutase
LIRQNQNILIAGPCSAESEEQMLEVAKAFKNIPVDILRAGVWKPRTRPNSFEGMGTQALVWLKNAGKLINKPVATEVANAKHVEEALKYEIDVLWVGARTTVNPFYVQEIADALKGVKIPVLIKNPVNPDLSLWIGAVERVAQAGITEIGVIHRGFSTYKKTQYRNDPMWQIPIDFKIHMPEIPVICDPSHIGGKRNTILEIAQKSIDLEMNGLMIETHPQPNNALSDAQQQITPTELQNIINQLNYRKSGNSSAENELKNLRNKIDALDEDILQFFKQRFDLVEQIGQYKKENQLTILQLKRWEHILKTRTKFSEELGLNADFTKKLLEIIHNESIKIQTNILNKNEQGNK